MSETPSTSLLVMLQQQLTAARETDEAVLREHKNGALLQVPGTGKILSSAYEQLRNAAEYTEEHLLLQHAIQRFYKRVLFIGGAKPETIGQELIVELTQAGYLQRDSFTTETADQLSRLATQFMETYSQVRQAHVSREKATDWIIGVLAVETENRLNPHNRSAVFAYVAYQHCIETLNRNAYTDGHDNAGDYELSMFVAVHQTLLKSDIAVVRASLLTMYGSTLHNMHDYVTFNKRIDELFKSELTRQLKRGINRRGAPLRILYSLVQDRDDLPELLDDQEAFNAAFNSAVHQEYKRIQQRINKGVIKSIVFILITKVLIGVGIEVPFDLLTEHKVIIVPLAINLLVPPIYMASLGLGLRLPSKGNAQDLLHYIDGILYGSGKVQLAVHDGPRRYRLSARILYSILFFVPFAVMVYLLYRLHFNALQMIIFFVFLSTASFLGFRLSSMVRELELLSRQTGLITSLRDFFYLPFILFGQWLSGKYAKINIVGYLLDIAIELPLKTVLRLVRQWIRFLNEKREEIY